MPRMEHIREVVSAPPTQEYLQQKAGAGWRLIALEWAREVEAGKEEPGPPKEDVPFGLRVADDCTHLEEDSTEKQILMLTMALIVDDSPLSRVASELNRRGFRTRHGSEWSPASVFKLLPRLVEVGPRIFSSADWSAQRKRFLPAPV